MELVIINNQILRAIVEMPKDNKLNSFLSKDIDDIINENEDSLDGLDTHCCMEWLLNKIKGFQNEEN